MKALYRYDGELYEVEVEPRSYGAGVMPLMGRKWLVSFSNPNLYLLEPTPADVEQLDRRIANPSATVRAVICYLEKQWYETEYGKVEYADRWYSNAINPVIHVHGLVCREQRQTSTPAKSRFYQDGGQFYEAETGKLVANYSFLVDNDHDTEGAQKAREQFLTVYGPWFEPEPAAPDKCGHCGAMKPTGQSCGCFDNGAQ